MVQALTSLRPGRSLGIVPRSFNESGYIDLKHDDYPEEDFLGEWQDTVIAAAHRLSVSLFGIGALLIATRLVITESRYRRIVNSLLTDTSSALFSSLLLFE
jgi:hypothetical protein